MWHKCELLDTFRDSLITYVQLANFSNQTHVRLNTPTHPFHTQPSPTKFRIALFYRVRRLFTKLPDPQPLFGELEDFPIPQS